jgi:TetR/AcrR family fatty acid metabolism transcriptional regulator
MTHTARSRAILTTASRLFAAKGYANATTSEIAREAGVAEGTLYHHFGSKDGIFLTLFDETLDGFLSGLDALLAREMSGRETLAALSRFWYDYVSRHQERFLILQRDFPPHLTVKHLANGSPQRARLDRITALFSRTLARGKADGTLHVPFPVRKSAEMLRGSFYGTTRLKMLGLIETSFPELARMTETYWLQALAPPRVKKKPRRTT